MSSDRVRSERGAEAKSTGGRACKGPGKAQPEGGGRRQRRGCEEGGHPQQPPRLREVNARKTEMPPSLVAENAYDLSESPSGGLRGQSRGQTSAGGGRAPRPVCCSEDGIKPTGWLAWHHET